jgi:hypothetical protein
VFHLGFAREGIKTRVLISSVSAANKTLYRWQYVACAPLVVVGCVVMGMYRGADKSLARPGRTQATATEDFEFHVSYL